MTLFLDTEFNGFGSGELISLALVSDSGQLNSEFYEVLSAPKNATPWVAANVIPVLAKTPISTAAFQKKLVNFLYQHAGEPIIADWHEDLICFLQMLSTAPGHAYRLNLTLRLVTPSEPLPSLTPHNALSDARALRDWWAINAS